MQHSSSMKEKVHTLKKEEVPSRHDHKFFFFRKMRRGDARDERRRAYWPPAARFLRYSSKEGAAEIDWRGSSSFTNGSGSRVSALRKKRRSHHAQTRTTITQRKKRHSHATLAEFGFGENCDGPGLHRRGHGGHHERRGGCEEREGGDHLHFASWFRDVARVLNDVRLEMFNPRIRVSVLVFRNATETHVALVTVSPVTASFFADGHRFET